MTDWREHGVRVVRGDELDPNTPQTEGMSRAAAITTARAGAEKLWAGTVVIEPGSDGRAATPRRPNDEPAQVTVARLQHARARRRCQSVEDEPAILAGRRAIEGGHRVEIVRTERPKRLIGRRAEPGRFERPIPGLDLEPRSLVQRPPTVRRDQQERLGALREGDVCHGIRQRRTDPVTPVIVRDPDRADPRDGPVDRGDTRSDDLAIEIRDDGVTGRAAKREFEPGATVAPVVGQDRRDGRVEVVTRHGAKARGHRHPTIIGRWPPCRARMSNTSLISLVSG